MGTLLVEQCEIKSDYLNEHFNWIWQFDFVAIVNEEVTLMDCMRFVIIWQWLMWLIHVLNVTNVVMSSIIASVHFSHVPSEARVASTSLQTVFSSSVFIPPLLLLSSVLKKKKITYVLFDDATYKLYSFLIECESW